MRSTFLFSATIVTALVGLAGCNLHDHGKRARAPMPEPVQTTTVTKAEAPAPPPALEPAPAPPPAPVKSDKIEIPAQIQFVKNSAKIAPGGESTKALEELARVLKENPRITRLRVEGHTDDRGGVKQNQKLSRDRAGAVVKWLVAHGVDKRRLEAAGLGSDRPVASNDTEEDRALNRRTEFHVVELDGKPFDPNEQELVFR
jgi:OOP family OmpA-OmpF porin